MSNQFKKSALREDYQASGLTKEQEEQVKNWHNRGHRISFIACKLGLTREYVQSVIKALNGWRKLGDVGSGELFVKPIS